MDEFEKYIRQNKDAFDEHEPSTALWSRIERQMQQKPTTGKVLLLKSLRWTVAAMLILCAGAGIYFFTKNQDHKIPDNIAKTSTPLYKNDSSNNEQEIIAPDVNDNTEKTAIIQHTEHPKLPSKNPPVGTEPDVLSKQEYHYSRLIELRQKEMEFVKQEDPALYKKFAKDLELLELSYDALKEKQKKGINEEQLIEAMMQNLRMQSELLNKQLEITRNIKNKKSEHEALNNL